MHYKPLLSFIGLLLSASSMAQTTEMFSPYKQTKLRLPSVPIVVNDPYFSIWSPWDHLNDGSTRHWDNDEKPIDGMLRVDGKTYCFMGAQEKSRLLPIAALGDDEPWEGRYTNTTPANGWQQPNFDDAAWQKGKAAWGTPGMLSVNTTWTGDNTDIYLRREVTLTADDLKRDLYVLFSHDDGMEVFINGVKVAEEGEGQFFRTQQQLDSKAKAALHAGRNVIAAHCHNNSGSLLADFGLYYKDIISTNSSEQAQQTSVSVLATNTYYTFKCGPVYLDLVFTAPMLIDDLDLLSTPVNYISYQVRSADGKPHDVKLLLTASPLIATWKGTQPMESSVVSEGGTNYLKTGTIDQPILAKQGDNICIDWGYLYLAGNNGKLSLADESSVRKQFATDGTLPEGKSLVRNYRELDMPTLAYLHDFGSTAQSSSYAMIGYDEVEDIEYMYRHYKALWAHEGKVTIFDAFRKLAANYSDIMERCRQMDKTIYDDALKAGGEKYAEILSGSYRQVIAAHKLFRDKDGKLLFFSKENNSNGCVNTVDLTYPSAPLFLIYNPELEEAMMTSIFDYSLDGRWTKPFAAHDLGTYPKANGQVYEGDGMPLEEAGNMIILASQIASQKGSTDFLNPYWEILRTWADYLVDNGQDPANQLCTDDFAGHWAHNANLSIKAIIGVAGFSRLCLLRGDKADADKYMATARKMANQWEQMDKEGDHYRLAFDRPDTWSMKYNIVWDKLWGTRLFSDDVVKTELSYYLKHQNKYGLPLDSRKDYTKSDWIMWTAAMAKSQKDFQKFIDPLWNYINETQSRVPISDWHDTKTGLWVNFRARSVIGGYWMRVLFDKQKQ